MPLGELLTLVFSLALLSFLIWASGYIISLIFSYFAGAPYVGTTQRDLARILETFPQESESQFVELGCGDGRVMRAFVKKYGCTAMGVDINPFVIWKGRIIARIHRLSRVDFHRSNLIGFDLSHADTIYLFLFPKLIADLEDTIRKTVRPGSLLISHGFPMPYLEGCETHRSRGPIFVTYGYRMPSRRS